MHASRWQAREPLRRREASDDGEPRRRSSLRAQAGAGALATALPPDGALEGRGDAPRLARVRMRVLLAAVQSAKSPTMLASVGAGFRALKEQEAVARVAPRRRSQLEPEKLLGGSERTPEEQAAADERSARVRAAKAASSRGVCIYAQPRLCGAWA